MHRNRCGRPMDPIWRYFSRVVDVSTGKCVLKCKKCQAMVSARANRMKVHWEKCCYQLAESGLKDDALMMPGLEIGSAFLSGQSSLPLFTGHVKRVPPTSVDESFGKKQDESISIKEEVQLVTQDTTPRPCDVQPSTSSLVPNISAAWSMPTSPSTSRGSPPNPTAGGSGVTTGATTMCLSPQLQFADSGDDEFSLSQKEHSLRMELLMYQLETARQQREMAQKEHEANMNLVWRKIEMVEVQKQWMEMQMDKMKDNAGMMGMQQFEDPTEQSATLLPD